MANLVAGAQLPHHQSNNHRCRGNVEYFEDNVVNWRSEQARVEITTTEYNQVQNLGLQRHTIARFLGKHLMKKQTDRNEVGKVCEIAKNVPLPSHTEQSDKALKSCLCDQKSAVNFTV